VIVDSDEDTLLKFPCEFPIKAIGRAHADLDSIVYGIVRAHAPDLGEGAVCLRASTQGNYLSVTVRVRATSRAQLDAIYRDLSASEQILMVL
jgi:putative lipoic acid-binding regulatory protein